MLDLLMALWDLLVLISNILGALLITVAFGSLWVMWQLFKWLWRNR